MCSEGLLTKWMLASILEVDLVFEPFCLVDDTTNSYCLRKWVVKYIDHVCDYSSIKIYQMRDFYWKTFALILHFFADFLLAKSQFGNMQDITFIWWEILHLYISSCKYMQDLAFSNVSSCIFERSCLFCKCISSEMLH